MGKDKNKKKKSQIEINTENIEAGLSIVSSHPLFGYDFHRRIYLDNKNMGKDCYAVTYSNGEIFLNRNKYLSPKQWAYVIVHNKLHLAFGHFDADNMPGYTITDEKGNKIKKTDYSPSLWNMACDIYVDKFLADVKFGQSIHDDVVSFIPGGADDEIKIYNYLLENNFSATQNKFGTAEIGAFDMKGLETPLTYDEQRGEYNEFSKRFTSALSCSVSKVICNAGGYDYDDDKYLSDRIRASKWFINHYPLLGGLASHFKIIEDQNYCIRNEIMIAAVDATCGEIYLNPAANFSYEEWKFVLAHEYLHAGLMHHERRNGRNAYLWNVACDYVINGWLHELQIGAMPKDGLLYDPDLKGMSAESIYDMIISDIRKYEKLGTFRGYSKGDILGDSSLKDANGVSLDDFCRSALQQGLEYHVANGRGLIPAGLIEEIRALAMPPIPWDVELAKWFDIYFAPLERHRTYARPSRRQASTPDIPRPRYTPYDIPVDSRTFGVIVDTSGSMDSRQIGQALGSIASYSVAHDVPFARVIFCDACAYDIGYVSPEDIAGKVAVKGRGGTILQPAVDLLENAKDFPKDGPILIITDGQIENHLSLKHEHAYLLPSGCRLPFSAKGKVFYMK